MVATTSPSEKNNVNLNSLLKYSFGKKYSQQCLVGDFNFNNINWFMWTTPHNEESKEVKFIETISDYYLYQHLLEPIRCRNTDNPSLIDLVLTNEVMQVSDVEYHPPIGKSDHCVISLNTFNCYFDYFQPKERYVYHKTDFNSTRKQLTGQKYSWYKIKASQLMNYEILLNLKFMKSEISSNKGSQNKIFSSF